MGPASLADALEAVLRAKRAAVNAASAWTRVDGTVEEEVEVEVVEAIPNVPERNLYVIDRVLTAGECKQIIQLAESRDALEHYTSPKSPEYAYRDHHRVKFQSTGLADVLWRETVLERAFDTLIGRGSRIVGRPIGLNPELKLYRYSGGESFGKHIDGSEVVSGGDGRPVGRTEYTVLFYLSNTVGGDTVFYDDEGHRIASIVPEQGKVVIHRHGQDKCLEHEALPVVEGSVKYVLRTDVVFSPGRTALFAPVGASR